MAKTSRRSSSIAVGSPIQGHGEITARPFASYSTIYSEGCATFPTPVFLFNARIGWRGDLDFTVDGGWPPVENESSLDLKTDPLVGTQAQSLEKGVLNVASITCHPVAAQIPQYFVTVHGTEESRQFKLQLDFAGFAGGRSHEEAFVL